MGNYIGYRITFNDSKKEYSKSGKYIDHMGFKNSKEAHVWAKSEAKYLGFKSYKLNIVQPNDLHRYMKRVKRTLNRKSTRKRVVKNTAKSTKLFKCVSGFYPSSNKKNKFKATKKYFTSSVEAMKWWKNNKVCAKNEISAMYKLNRTNKVFKMIKYAKGSSL